VTTSIYDQLKIYDQSQQIRLEPDRTTYLLNQVKGKRLLHVGCTDAPITPDRLAEGTLLHLKLRQVTTSILGIDIAEKELAQLRMHGCDDVTLMDAEALSLNERFDCILAGDVVEHLNNPGLFLQGAVQHLLPGGEIIIGVPSALSAGIVKTWLLGIEDVHRDHTFYFSPKTLAELCRRFGLLPTRLVFTTQPALASESKVFIAVRSLLIRMQPALSPSLIMHFSRAHEVDQTRFVIWR
jgi:2-polyprenyl-3-methyl-5-hydroxy-6-metoxy-1,4-benzoquinol methylase